MTPIYQFLWGAAGSFAVEVVVLYLSLVTGRPLARRFHRTSYWVVRLLVTVVAGIVAMAFQVQFPREAMEIGIATPLIVNSLAHKSPVAASSSRR